MGAMSCICNKHYDDEDTYGNGDGDDDDGSDNDNGRLRHRTSIDYHNYVTEQLIIDQMFPRAKFVVSIPLPEIDDVVTDLKQIIIKQTFDCYCYVGIPTRSHEIHPTMKDTLFLNGSPFIVVTMRK
jgi:hypothetical protein